MELIKKKWLLDILLVLCSRTLVPFRSQRQHKTFQLKVFSLEIQRNPNLFYSKPAGRLLGPYVHYLGDTIPFIYSLFLRKTHSAKALSQD